MLASHWNDRRLLDISGTLPNGEKYKSFTEFKRLVVSQEARFLKGLSEKLLVYALGRPVEGTDREAIDNVVAAAKRDGATLRSMIQNIAATKAFQTKTPAAY